MNDKQSAIWKLREARSPWAGEPRGHYLMVARPNMDGRGQMGEFPLFTRPYWLEAPRLVVTEADVAEVLAEWEKRYVLEEVGGGKRTARGKPVNVEDILRGLGE